MKLTDMKLSAKEAKDDVGMPATAKSNLPKYPYGLELRFDTEALKKLGIDIKDFELGETCLIEARAIVCDTSQSQRLGGKARSNLELQITDIGIGDDKAAKKAKAKDKQLESISRPTTAPYSED